MHRSGVGARMGPGLALLAVGLVSQAGALNPRVYQDCSLGEWTIRVESGLFRESPSLAAQALTLLESKLEEIDRLLPADKLSVLQQRPIWLSRDNGRGAAFHPSRQWLLDHDRNPDMAGCVEIANARNFLDWSENQPMMVLHELAHALHHRQYRFEHPPLRQVYRKGRDAGLYDTLPRWQGPVGPAYALTNHKEYFAELSEALFGLNDIYPFTHDDLLRHDPEGFTIVRQMWFDSLHPTLAHPVDD